MIKFTFHKRLHIIFLILFLTSFIAIPLEGSILKGTVKGKNGRIKRYVRVEIGGPETKITFTHKDGTFSIKLKGGEYIVKIIERTRSMGFKVKVPQSLPKEEDKVIEETFELKW